MSEGCEVSGHYQREERKRNLPGTIETIRTRFRKIAEERQLLEADVSVLAKPLTPEEAIGSPGRRDFPIIIGKERVVEATVRGARGHAFTDSRREFIGSLAEVLEMELRTNHERAVFIATLNATLGHLDMVEATVHCKDEEPEECAVEIAQLVLHRVGKVDVGLIGLNPAIAQRLSEVFGSEHLRITDLDRDNIGRQKFGVEVWDGSRRTEELVRSSEMVVFTGTTLVNGTFDDILELVQRLERRYLVYGMTASGASHLMGFERICPRGRAS